MIVRINPREWLSWCREGTQVEMLAITCKNKLRKIGFDVLVMGHPLLPNQNSYPHLDFDKFLRSGLLGKKHDVVCTTNKKGMFGPDYKPKPFNPANFGKRRHEYVS